MYPGDTKFTGETRLIFYLAVINHLLILFSQVNRISLYAYNLISFLYFNGKLNVEVKVLSMFQFGNHDLPNPLAFAEGLFIFINPKGRIPRACPWMNE
jgi:hypothetical protein